MPKLIAALDLQSESATKPKSDTNVILDLSRQYKTMQTELTSKVKRLETEASQLKEELGMNTCHFTYIQWQLSPRVKMMACQ